MNYSNPRLQATFTDWPYGSLRTTATFTVESHPTRGQRVSRVTLNPRTGRPTIPKTTTYSQKVRIVDGTDGKTYIAGLTFFGHVSIMRGTLDTSVETFFDNHPEYPTALALFN